MFKGSFGCILHAWVMSRRLKPAEVAARCGYAHLSHLNAAPRRAGLASASRYRAVGEAGGSASVMNTLFTSST